MYTGASVRQRLRIVAMATMLAVAGAPAAALACQWVCASQTGHAHHRAAGPHDMAMGGSSHSMDDAPSLVAGEPACDHAMTTTPGIALSALKLLPPVAMPAPVVVVGVPVLLTHEHGSSTAHSPPGSSTRLTALRI